MAQESRVQKAIQEQERHGKITRSISGAILLPMLPRAVPMRASLLHWSVLDTHLSPTLKPDGLRLIYLKMVFKCFAGFIVHLPQTDSLFQEQYDV